jgi:hypothetical protein
LVEAEVAIGVVAADPTGLTRGFYTATITIVEDTAGDPTHAGATVEVVS